MDSDFILSSEVSERSERALLRKFGDETKFATAAWALERVRCFFGVGDCERGDSDGEKSGVRFGPRFRELCGVFMRLASADVFSSFFDEVLVAEGGCFVEDAIGFEARRVLERCGCSTEPYVNRNSWRDTKIVGRKRIKRQHLAYGRVREQSYQSRELDEGVLPRAKRN